MKVVLEFLNGPLTGQKRWLVDGQSLKIGRTEWADVVVQDDQEMSSVHFQIECKNGSCFVRDENSSNGTFVNEERITESKLKGGDVIRAGRTVFGTHLEGFSPSESDDDSSVSDMPDSHATGSEPTSAGVNANAPAASLPRKTRQAPAGVSVIVGKERRSQNIFEKKQCRAEIMMYSGETNPEEGAVISDQLTDLAPMHLVVDFDKLQKPIPEDLKETNNLFKWMPGQHLEGFALIYMPPTDGPDLSFMLQEAWGHDSVIAIFSQLPQDQLLEHLRTVAGAFAAPSILRRQLSEGEADFASGLLKDIEAVLTEGESQATWTVFGSDDVDAVLRKAGFCQMDTTDSDAER